MKLFKMLLNEDVIAKEKYIDSSNNYIEFNQDGSLNNYNGNPPISKNYILIDGDIYLVNGLDKQAYAYKLDNGVLDKQNPIIFTLESEIKAKKQAEAERQANLDNITKKYKVIIDRVKNNLDVTDSEADNYPLSILFNSLVPRSGHAPTKAGELVRAMMKILYRDWNDGDVFYSGYGLETAGPAAVYLMDNGYDDEFSKILNTELENEQYTKAIEDISIKLVNDIINNPELFLENNEEDMLDTPTDWLIENQPRYDYELDIDWDLLDLESEGKVSFDDLYEYAESNLSYEFRDAEFSSYGNNILVSNLTKDDIDRLEHIMNRGNFWEYFLEEYPIEEDDDDSDSENDEE